MEEVKTISQNNLSHKKRERDNDTYDREETSINININNEPNHMSFTPIIQDKIILTSRAGGVYIPPFKLAKMMEEIRKKDDKSSSDYQRMMWEMLRKSINGVINKVNISSKQKTFIFFPLLCI